MQNITNTPAISVVMAVYNEIPERLDKAINHVLNQTISAYEFIIINDGSKPYITEILNKFNDPKIKIINNKSNIGLTKSLIKAIKTAKGKYIARIDSDDYCLPERLEKQFNYMEKNHNIVLLGSNFRELTNDKDISSSGSLIKDSKNIKKIISYYNPFAHSTLFFKKESYNQIGGYNPSIKYAQDYDLNVRLLSVGDADILSDILVHRNIDTNCISIKKAKAQRLSSLKTKVLAYKLHGGGLKFYYYFLKTSLGLFVPPKLRFLIRLWS